MEIVIYVVLGIVAVVVLFAVATVIIGVRAVRRDRREEEMYAGARREMDLLTYGVVQGILATQRNEREAGDASPDAPELTQEQIDAYAKARADEHWHSDIAAAEKSLAEENARAESEPDDIDHLSDNLSGEYVKRALKRGQSRHWIEKDGRIQRHDS